ncbi:MAG: hypothetical protein ACRDZO_08170 [Egibacteraceae bacterium]
MTDDASFDDFSQAAAELEARLATGSLDSALVHTATSVFGHLGRGEAVVDLLTRYLDQPLPADEEAWARGELVDQLAVLGRCDEAVEAQLALLDWARAALPVDRLLWIMADGTQALCWVTIGRQEEWLTIFAELLDETVPAPDNRLDRLYLLRTAGVILAELGRHEEALQLARRMRRIADEDPGWDRGFWAWTEARVLQLHAYRAAGQRNTLRRSAVAVTALLDHQFELQQAGQEPAADPATLRTLYQNAGVPLYRAGEYDLAIPLFERAIDLGSTAPQVREWLARARAALDE